MFLKTRVKVDDAYSRIINNLECIGLFGSLCEISGIYWERVETLGWILLDMNLQIPLNFLKIEGALPSLSEEHVKACTPSSCLAWSY